MYIEVECFATGEGKGFNQVNRTKIVRKMAELALPVAKPNQDPEILHSGPHHLPVEKYAELLTQVEQLTKMRQVRFVNIFFSTKAN